MTDTIQQEDINHLNTIVADISAKNNYETLKIIPVYREIDDHKKEKDPLGLKGKKLSLIADVFLVPKNFYQNLVDVFEKLELNVVDIIPNILASSEAILDFDLKDLGTILIDIGHNQTSFVVYEE
jgi:cell division protein FtsA